MSVSRVRPRELALVRVVLGLVVFAAFGVRMRFAFTLDDFAAIVRNPLVQEWRGVWRSFSAPYWPLTEGGFDPALYRPVLISVFTALWQLGSGAPWIFHVAGLLMHALVGVLAFLVVRRWVPLAPALLGVVAFLVHARRVEAVGSAVGLAEILVSVWVLGAVLVARRRTSWWRAFALGGLYFLAIGTKESGVLLPVLVLMTMLASPGALLPSTSSVGREGRVPPSGWVSWSRALWREWQRDAVVSLVAFVRIALLRLNASPSLAIAGAEGIVGVSAWARWWTMVQTWPWILGVLTVPSAAHHAHVFDPSMVVPRGGPSMAEAVVVASVLFWLGGGVVAWRRRVRVPLCATGWLVAAFLPASNLLLPTTQLFAERTLYTAGLVTVVWVSALSCFVVRSMWWRSQRRAIRVGAAATTWSVVLFVGVGTVLPWLSAWRSNEALFLRDVTWHPQRPVAWDHYSVALAARGDLCGAMAANRTARALWPARLRLWQNGVRWAARARLVTPEAQRLVADARVRFPDDYQLALLELEWRRRGFGSDSVAVAIRRGVGGDGPATLWLLARRYEAEGRHHEAAQVVRRALARWPRDPGLTVFAEAAHLDVR